MHLRTLPDARRTENPGMYDDIVTPRLCLRTMPVDFLEAWIADERDRAEAILGLRVPANWRPETRLLELRLHECRRDREYIPWSLRAIGLHTTKEVVGHIGFHTRPNPSYLQSLAAGGVELGYEVDAAHRRQGYAAEAIRGMLAWAVRRHGVESFVVSIAPANVASQALAAKLGFLKIGGHMDEIDGYEDILVLRRGAD